MFYIDIVKVLYTCCVVLPVTVDFLKVHFDYWIIEEEKNVNQGGLKLFWKRTYTKRCDLLPENVTANCQLRSGNIWAGYKRLKKKKKVKL